MRVSTRFVFCVSLVLLSVALGHAQQPAPPPDCQTQLGMCHNRQGQCQTLAKDDREALILYFQAELRKKMQEIDALQKQLDERKQGKEPGS